MADFVGTASGNTDNAKAQALNNIAQTGQAQAAGFGQAQANDAAAKTAALKSAMAMAALRGAPSGNVAQGQATIAAPLDQRATTLDTIKGNYAANNANRAQNFGQFFDLTKAGLPIAEQRYKEQAGQLQEKAAERAAALRDAAQARDDAHQLALMRLQKASAGPTPAQIVAGLGGSAAAGTDIQQAAQNVTSGRLGRSMNDSTTSLAQNDQSSGALQDQIGQAVGLPPNEGTTLTAKDNAPPPLPAENARDKGLGEAIGLTPNPGTTYTEHISAIRANPDYPTAQNIVNGVVAHNGTSQDLQAALAQANINPLVASLVMAENPNLRPTRGSAS